VKSADRVSFHSSPKFTLFLRKPGFQLEGFPTLLYRMSRKIERISSDYVDLRRFFLFLSAKTRIISVIRVLFWAVKNPLYGRESNAKDSRGTGGTPAASENRLAFRGPGVDFSLKYQFSPTRAFLQARFG
jgi:hypothetical protein